MHATRAVGLIVSMAAAAAAIPVRRDVVGFSMGPGLMPGDRVASGMMPLRDRWRTPAPHERWIVTAPGGVEAIKRVAARGAGTLRIVDGDLECDGRIAPPPPASLLERMTVVREVAWAREAASPRIVSEGIEVLDDAEFAPDERRLLLPVRDVGVCVVARVAGAAPATRTERVVIGVGDRSVAWRPGRGGSFVFIAGSVDRHLVAGAWRLASAGGDSGFGRRRLEADAPDWWGISEPIGIRDAAPRLTLSHEGGAAGGVTIGGVWVWRDVLHRPAADGTTSWRLDDDDVFLLGDFPSGSVDSRQWGPLPRRALRYRVAAASTP